MNAVVVTELSISQTPSKVFTQDLSARLQAINEARRELRELGYQVGRQIVGQGGNKRPLLELSNGDERLRRRVTQLLIKRDGKYSLMVARFGAVDLMWQVTS